MVGGEGAGTKVRTFVSIWMNTLILKIIQARFHTERLFKMIDLDGDGFLSESEFIGVSLIKVIISYDKMFQGCVQDNDLMSELKNINLDRMHRFEGEAQYQETKKKCKMRCCWPETTKTLVRG